MGEKMILSLFKFCIFLILFVTIQCQQTNQQQQPQMQTQETQNIFTSSGQTDYLKDTQHAPLLQQPSTNYYQNRQAGYASTGTGVVSFLPIAFVAGFGLLLLIPLLLLFFSSGFGPGLGYAGYSSRKRSIDDIFEPVYSNLNPFLTNLAKNSTFMDLFKKAEKDSVMSNLQPIISNFMNGKSLNSEQIKSNLHNLINPIIKDVVPSEWRRTAVQLASKLMKNFSDPNLSKNEYFVKNSNMENKTNIKIVQTDRKDNSNHKQQ